MTVLTAEQALAATTSALALTDAEFETAHSSVRVAIETATSTGYYTAQVDLTLLAYNEVNLYLTAKGYRLTTNRDGASACVTRAVAITWLPLV